MRKKYILLAMVIILTMFNLMSFAHSGRTDSAGGHKDNKNVSGLGSYHYHHGMGPHLHINGICPYSTSIQNKTYENPSTTKSNSFKVSYDKIVEDYQNKLNAIGYSCGAVDGLLGNKTLSAIKSFQKDNLLVFDGRLNDATKTTIDKKFRDLKPEIKVLTKSQIIQIRLNELGYNCGIADGIIGPITKKAIMKFQEDNNLVIDGIVGPITSKAMGI